jgi:hypothetical protein
MMRSLAAALVAALIAGSGMGASSAQGQGAEDGSSRPWDYVPNDDALGDSWTRASDVGPAETDDDVFAGASFVVFLGEDGARALLLVAVAQPSRTAVQRSWEQAGEWFDFYRYQIEADYDREGELAAQPLPEGCVDARRVDGYDPVFVQPAGVTLCAVDPDVILIAVVYGPLRWADGTVRVGGVAASDRLALLAIEAGRSEVPSATPAG